MDPARRAELARRALAGYESGPDAPQRATAEALPRVGRAEAVILVEGICDQMAIETLAARQDRRLEAEGVVVLPIGGAQAAPHYLRAYGPEGDRLEVVGLFDLDATETVRQAVIGAGLGQPQTVGDLADLGFELCVRDLEDELIRAVGPDRVMAVVDSQGDLGSFRTLQKQPQWRDRPVGDQLRRFLGSKARRGQRYARLLTEAVELDHAPRPLATVLDRV